MDQNILIYLPLGFAGGFDGFGIVSTVVVLGRRSASLIGMNLPEPESRPRLFTILVSFEIVDFNDDATLCLHLYRHSCR